MEAQNVSLRSWPWAAGQRAPTCDSEGSLLPSASSLEPFMSAECWLTLGEAEAKGTEAQSDGGTWAWRSDWKRRTDRRPAGSCCVQGNPLPQISPVPKKEPQNEPGWGDRNVSGSPMTRTFTGTWGNVATGAEKTIHFVLVQRLLKNKRVVNSLNCFAGYLF